MSHESPSHHGAAGRRAGRAAKRAAAELRERVRNIHSGSGRALVILGGVLGGSMFLTKL